MRKERGGRRKWRWWEKGKRREEREGEGEGEGEEGYDGHFC